MTEVLRRPVTDEADEDKELHADLKMLIDRIAQSNDMKAILPTIDMLKYLIRTSTTSMTSVPKPIKYLGPHFADIKKSQIAMKESRAKRRLADIISVLAMGQINSEGMSRDLDCLNFCLKGTLKDIGDWGHDYIRQLEKEIVHEWSFFEEIESPLMPIVKEILQFDFEHHDEIQACDLLMELDLTHLLFDYVNENNFEQTCLYLSDCSKHLEEIEAEKIKKITFSLYFKFENYPKALITALAMDNAELVAETFARTDEKYVLLQMAFICARHFYRVDGAVAADDEQIANILNNGHLSANFISFGRELDVLEPKTPEDVYKIWLEHRPQILAEKLDSSLQNLASTFVNGFVNCGFGSDKLLTADGGGTKWIFRNKDLGMMSATAALGLIFLWDVDGGLTPIDKFFYSSETKVKAGALLALGIVNCRVRNECDPALAILSQFIENEPEETQIGAILGIGMAYAGTARDDVLNVLLTVIENSKYVKILGMTSLACGLISVGRTKSQFPNLVMTKIMEANGSDVMKSPFMMLAALGVGLGYFNCKEDIEVPCRVVEMLEEPFQTMFSMILKMCAYAGSGNVLIIQELLRAVQEQVDVPSNVLLDATTAKKEHSRKKRYEWDYYMGKSLAVLAAAAVATGEELGMEMIQRIFGQTARYGEPTVRKAVPLAIALTSVSNPQPNVVNILTKYSHDTDNDVACNAIFSLGYVGAGTNNARLAQTLRQLAQYHAKNPNHLFMVRLAQGLIHLGKGTMTLDPCHQNRQLVDPLGLASLLIPLVSLINPQSLILARSHYLLYTLAGAIQPRWLLALDHDLNSVNVVVRVGQAVDVVGKAGAPKTISGIHTHTTPVLLNSGERAELVGEDYQNCAPIMEGICVLKKN